MRLDKPSGDGRARGSVMGSESVHEQMSGALLVCRAKAKAWRKVRERTTTRDQPAKFVGCVNAKKLAWFDKPSGDGRARCSVKSPGSVNRCLEHC